MSHNPADSAKLEALWVEHYPAVLAYGRRRASDDVAAEVAAEVFGVAWRRLDDVPGNPRPWLLGVARRVLANHRRADGRRARLVSRLKDDVRGRAPGQGDEGIEGVERALARLTDREREALLLIAWDGLDAREAAIVCGCTQAAFRVRLHRARRRFAEALGRLPHAVAATTPSPTPDEEGVS